MPVEYEHYRRKIVQKKKLENKFIKKTIIRHEIDKDSI